MNFLTGKMQNKKPKNKSPEAGVGRAIDSYMSTLGAYGRTIKSEGNKHSGKWRPSTQGTGISDRLYWLPNANFIAVELKAPGKKKTTTEAQYSFLKALIVRGHRGCVADCVKDVQVALKQSTQELLDTLELFKPRTAEFPQSSEPLFP